MTISTNITSTLAILLQIYSFDSSAQCCETVFHDGHSTNDRNKIGFLVLWLKLKQMIRT